MEAATTDGEHDLDGILHDIGSIRDSRLKRASRAIRHEPLPRLQPPLLLCEITFRNRS